MGAFPPYAGDQRLGQLDRQGGGEEEPARLDTGDHVDVPSGAVVGHQVDGVVEGLGLLQEGRDVLEQDPRLGEVWNLAYPSFQIHGYLRRPMIGTRA